MAILFTTSWEKDAKYWLPALEENLPGMPIYRPGDAEVDWGAIEYAVVWEPAPGVLSRCPNLQAIFNMGAGVDGILKNANVPENIPIVRLVDPCLTEGMIEYVTHWVLHYHRGFHRYRDYQGQSKWRPHWYPRPGARKVGILGLGELGGACARHLAAMGFSVAGWSRTKKTIEGVASFAGETELDSFLALSEILVCLLPLTPETAGLLDKKTFAAMPKGGFVINAARGSHVVDADLIDALDTGHLAGATLDVFHEEPLPANHPFWTHPKITVTPHVASLTNPKTASMEIARDIRLMQAGQPARHIVDVARGY